MAEIFLFDVVIVGGSYAGLAAGLTLGRSLRQVLIIDSGKPCNRQTPHSHNFLTQDGATPAAILKQGKEQVLQYPTVQWINGLVSTAQKAGEDFVVTTNSGDTFRTKKLLFATGVQDQMPDIPGFAACWGISVLYCPYCHGYEVKNQLLGLLANGDLAFEFCRLIHNWSPKLTLFTNGPSSLTPEQLAKISAYQIEVREQRILSLEHKGGMIQRVVLEGGEGVEVSAIFSRVQFSQHCTIPEQLGCALTEQGLIKVDDFQRTSERGIYAAGDSATLFRSVAIAVASGMKAGAAINKELIDETF